MDRSLTALRLLTTLKYINKRIYAGQCRHVHRAAWNRGIGIAEFNISLDTLYVISEIILRVGCSKQ